MTGRRFEMQATSHFAVSTLRGKVDVIPGDVLRVEFAEDDPKAMNDWAEVCLFWAEAVLGPMQRFDANEHGDDL